MKEKERAGELRDGGESERENEREREKSEKNQKK